MNYVVTKLILYDLCYDKITFVSQNYFLSEYFQVLYTKFTSSVAEWLERSLRGPGSIPGRVKPNKFTLVDEAPCQALDI